MAALARCPRPDLGASVAHALALARLCAASELDAYLRDRNTVWHCVQIGHESDCDAAVRGSRNQSALPRPRRQCRSLALDAGGRDTGAGFGEETLFRGFLFERLGKLLGTDRAALVATVLLTSGLFALAHYHDQGVPGVEQAAVAGVVFGTIYALEGESGCRWSRMRSLTSRQLR
jgi:hypothetical protein